MNSRDKIKAKADLAAALSGDAPVMLVIGSFDPLLAAHAERLSGLADADEARLVAAITDPVDAILSLTARLEMVAALGVVDFVLPYESGIETAFGWAAVHDDAALHDVWTADFKQHVRRRSQPAV